MVVESEKQGNLHRFVSETEQQYVNEEGRDPVVHKCTVVVVHTGMFHRPSWIPDEKTWIFECSKAERSYDDGYCATDQWRGRRSYGNIRSGQSL